MANVQGEPLHLMALSGLRDLRSHVLMQYQHHHFPHVRLTPEVLCRSLVLTGDDPHQTLERRLPCPLDLVEYGAYQSLLLRKVMAVTGIDKSSDLAQFP
jgi:hypothetical protein